MSPQRLNAVLFAGQARLPKIGMEARVAAPLSSPREPPQSVLLRSRVLQKLLQNGLASDEQRDVCLKLLADNRGLDAMTENAFQTFVGEVARSKYKEDLFTVSMLLALGEPSKSTHPPKAKTKFFRALINLQVDGIARFMQIQGNPNVSQEEKNASINVLIRGIHATIREKHPTIAEALNAIAKTSGETAPEDQHYAQMISQLNQIPPRSL